ncbi:MAG: UbiA family prenyltransferase [candidate division WOR-3 bacterium]|nr:MAG: UbiA family prenyltransferase [candidate division WOR-3 bacterium]
MPKSNPFDFFFILRPLILIPSWNFLLIGSYLASRQGGLTPHILMGLLVYTCVMGGVYILNQIMDIETDRMNKKLFLLTGGFVTRRAAYTEMVILWTIAVVVSLWFGRLFLLFIVFSILMGIMYSVPPLKLKGKPILDTLANGMGYGMINFAIGWLLLSPFEPAMFIRFLPYFLSIGAVFINTTVVDIEGDRKAREWTTGVFLGAKVSSLVSTLIMGGAIAAAYIQHDYICLVPAVVSWPLFIYSAAYVLFKDRIHRKMTIASFRLPGLVFTVITALLYPMYFVILIAVLFSMRIYYKRRFGMTYPTLAQG